MTPGPQPNRRSTSVYARNNNHDSGLHADVETMKVIVLGRANIGKTSLTRRFVHNEYSSVESTVSSPTVVNQQPHSSCDSSLITLVHRVIFSIQPVVWISV